MLPVYRHMFESKRGKQATYEDRIRMCELNFSHIPNVIVSRAEEECFALHLERADNNIDPSSIRVGTADLLEMLHDQFPNVDFTLALGEDTFMDLTSWKWRRALDVINFVAGRVVVLRRKFEDESILELSEREQTLNKRMIEINSKFPPLPDGTEQRTRCIQVSSLSAVSSTLIRSTTDEKLLRCHLDENVLEYIKLKKLYKFSLDG